MPYVSRIVMLEGRPYLDGGIADSVPLAAFERMGYARNVVVLTKEEGFERRSDNIPLLNFRYRQYPRFLETLARRVELCEAEERYIPVSYTHLDVYKRQMERSSAHSGMTAAES